MLATGGGSVPDCPHLQNDYQCIKAPLCKGGCHDSDWGIVP